MSNTLTKKEIWFLMFLSGAIILANGLSIASKGLFGILVGVALTITATVEIKNKE